MKFKSLVLSVLAVATVAAQAHTDVRIGRERPILSADTMKIVRTTGDYNEARSVSVTLTRQDGARRPTGIRVSIDGRARLYPIVRFGSNCGSKVYYAEEVFGAMDGGPMWKTTIALQDNHTRLCEDIRPGVWELSMEKMDLGVRIPEDDRSVGTLEAFGNPGPVVTPQ